MNNSSSSATVNSNLNNPLLDNGNPPRYTNNNNSLNLIDKGKSVVRDSVGIFTDSKSPLFSNSSNDKLNQLDNNSLTNSNKSVEESSVYSISIKTPLIEALELNLRNKNAIVEQIRLLKLQGNLIDRDNKELYEDLLNLIRQYNTKFDHISLEMFRIMIETEQIDIRDPELWNSSRNVSKNYQESMTSFFASPETKELFIKNFGPNLEEYTNEEIIEDTNKFKKGKNLSVFKKIGKKLSGIFSKEYETTKFNTASGGGAGPQPENNNVKTLRKSKSLSNLR